MSRKFITAYPVFSRCCKISIPTIFWKSRNWHNAKTIFLIKLHIVLLSIFSSRKSPLWISGHITKIRPRFKTFSNLHITQTFKNPLPIAILPMILLHKLILAKWIHSIAAHFSMVVQNHWGIVKRNRRANSVDCPFLIWHHRWALLASLPNTQ